MDSIQRIFCKKKKEKNSLSAQRYNEHKENQLKYVTSLYYLKMGLRLSKVIGLVEMLINL
jgi:hypothetical protein